MVNRTAELSPSIACDGGATHTTGMSVLDTRSHFSGDRVRCYLA